MPAGRIHPGASGHGATEQAFWRGRSGSAVLRASSQLGGYVRASTMDRCHTK
jgi:hypothetical protein